jgi:hypothetical protein
MKRLISGAMRRGQSFAFIFLSVSFLMTGCKKENSTPALNEEEFQTKSNQQKESNGFGNYTGLAPETVWELQQAKIATARYNDFQQAINDGYVDINVIVPEMGYHYLKMDNLDGTFDYAKPEILVYNKEENGRMKLLALEYATPVSATPPAGFTGDQDVWSVYQGVLWTLHAWVWEYNPAGVFNPTNPLIHVH